MTHTRDKVSATRLVSATSLHLVVRVEDRTWVLHATITSTIGILLSFRLIGKIGWASIGTLATAPRAFSTNSFTAASSVLYRTSADSIVHFRTQILAARNWGEYQNPTLTSAGEQN